MNLYRISQRKNSEYDTFDSAIVAAESEKDASKIHPNGREDIPNERESGLFGSWVNNPKHVKAKLIGVALEGTVRGVICASYNAG
jgi:hypothetical protein